MLIGHLYFLLEEISIQVLCPFFNQVICFVVVERVGHFICLVHYCIPGTYSRTWRIVYALSLLTEHLLKYLSLSEITE